MGNSEMCTSLRVVAVRTAHCNKLTHRGGAIIDRRHEGVSCWTSLTHVCSSCWARGSTFRPFDVQDWRSVDCVVRLLSRLLLCILLPSISTHRKDDGQGTATMSISPCTQLTKSLGWLNIYKTALSSKAAVRAECFDNAMCLRERDRASGTELASRLSPAAVLWYPEDLANGPTIRAMVPDWEIKLMSGIGILVISLPNLSGHAVSARGKESRRARIPTPQATGPYACGTNPAEHPGSFILRGPGPGRCKR